jgi:hypothetical protein
MKTLKEEADHYSECHQDVSGELGKYLVSAVFQDGANSKWAQAERIRAKIEFFEHLGFDWDLEHEYPREYQIELNYLQRQLKELEDGL